MEKSKKFYYFQPVLNCKKGKIAEKVFCEGEYDELPNFQKYIGKRAIGYQQDWEDDFIKCVNENSFQSSKFNNIVFSEIGLLKLEIFFQNDDNFGKFLCQKMIENTYEFVKQNGSKKFEKFETEYTQSPFECNSYCTETVIESRSKHYFIFGNFLIDMFGRYQCKSIFEDFWKSHTKINFFHCYEAWEIFIITSDIKLINVLIKNNSEIFKNVFGKVLNVIESNQIESNFYSYLYDILYYYNFYEKDFSKQMLKIMFEICQNKISIFSRMFDSFIKNFKRFGGCFFVKYFYKILYSGIGSFRENNNLLYSIIKNDNFRHLSIYANKKINKKRGKVEEQKYWNLRDLEKRISCMHENILEQSVVFDDGYYIKNSSDGHNCGLIKETSIKVSIGEHIPNVFF